MISYSEIRVRAKIKEIDYEGMELGLALELADWSIVATAANLNCSPTTLRRALERHPHLLAECVDGRGRPKKVKKEA